ncbi:MAG: hypothetical protein Q7R73_00790 [bacterium]|nr:hypothetical protein [bacterium]
MHPYIGVTGFTKLEEVAAALEVFPHNHSRKLMIGGLASWKSLRGIPLKPIRQKRFPAPELFNSIFPNDTRAVNLIHYSMGERKNDDGALLADMLKIHELAGPNFQGFQLNIAWPEIDQIAEYRMVMGFDYRIVLQISHEAIEAAGGTPKGVTDMLSYYPGFIDDILIDASGGLGKELDTERAREFLSKINMRLDIGLGTAGGLGPDSLHLIEPLLEEFPDLNIDAEGKLRTAENELAIGAMKTYLSKSTQLFSS